MTMDNPSFHALADVLNERIAQRRKYDDAHDDQHSRQEWAEIIDGYVVASVNADEDDEYRAALVAVAATSLAALESHKRQLNAMPRRLT